jgi:hypothetical protein
LIEQLESQWRACSDDQHTGPDASPPRSHWPLLSRCRWGLVTILWLSILTVGFALVIDYHTRPGVAAAAPRHWPTASALTLSQQGATLVMFIHPQCPCSNASLLELEALLKQTATPSRSFIVLVNSLADHSPTETWATAHGMTGVTVVSDTSGRETELFGSQTSGDLFVFDRDGRLTFQGGITAGRGHVGQGVSSQTAKEAILHGRALERRPVFGCPLVDSAGGVAIR